MRSLALWAMVLMLVVGVFLFLSEREETGRTVTLESPSAEGAEESYEIITLLPKDGIPAVYRPEIIDLQSANGEYRDDDLVIGVEIDGEARAYNIPFLSRREIVNDSLGGRKIAVTW